MGRVGQVSQVGQVGKAVYSISLIRPTPSYQPHPSYQPWTLSVLCESQDGYRNLCRLITRMKLRAPKGEGALALDELDGSTSGLVALVGRAALNGYRDGVGGLLDRVVGMFGRGSTYVEIQRHFRRDEEADNERLIDLAAAFRVPTLATGGVRFATSADRPLFDVLTCMHHHTDLAHAGRRLAPNAERYLKSPADMAALFADVPDAIGRTADLADRLQFTMADLGYRFPAYPVPPGDTEASFLRKIAGVGARERYQPYTDRARAQITRELDLIEKLNLAGYFLIVWDIVNFCRQHDILVQGRGSAANSAVCYSLGITAVDPVGMDLLFERFLSEERGEWPDIDLDLPSGDRRERVIQHVYEKYGRLGAAMTANVITYRGRSAAREVGKALGFEPLQIDRLAKVMNNFEFVDPADTLPRHLASVGLDVHDGSRPPVRAPLGRDAGFAAASRPALRRHGDLPGTARRRRPARKRLHAGPRRRPVGQGRLRRHGDCESRSAGAWDDGRDPGRPGARERRTTTVNAETADHREHRWDTLSASSAFNRRVVDLERTDDSYQNLSSVISVSSVVKPPLVDLAHLPQDDPAVYAMLCAADTIGVFQVESRAQMATLPRLKPTVFYDLVVEVAIIRPGPIVGQMVHPYLNRRAGREPVSYPHPSLEPILKRTLGVPLFQEQLLRIAMVAAGFTGGQAEELRRAMGFKRSERRMKPIEVQLRDGMAQRGITGDAAEQIITAIASFALYGFPESHAASFALLAYASAYLKVHYPAAFYTALLNNQPMGFYHPSTLVKDAQRRGVRFHPIDVQRSDWDCTRRIRRRHSAGTALRQRPSRTGRPRDCAESSGRLGARRVSIALRRGPSPPADAAPRLPHLPAPALLCPKCGCDDESMLEPTDNGGVFCNVCSHHSSRLRAAGASGSRIRFASVDELVSRGRCATRRARHARRHRRAQLARLRSTLGLVAGRARRTTIRRAVHDDQRRERRERTRSLSGSRSSLRTLRDLCVELS